MLRVQPTDQIGALERETLANLERDGLRHTQFVKSNQEDRERAVSLGWDSKLLDFKIPDHPQQQNFEAVLDSLAGFTRCSESCAYIQKVAAMAGVTFRFGPMEGAFDSLVEESSHVGPAQKKSIGLKTKEGLFHRADVVVIAGKSSKQGLFLSYYLSFYCISGIFLNPNIA